MKSQKIDQKTETHLEGLVKPQLIGTFKYLKTDDF
jgi:hypothetical protein